MAEHGIEFGKQFHASPDGLQIAFLPLAYLIADAGGKRIPESAGRLRKSPPHVHFGRNLLVEFRMCQRSDVAQLQITDFKLFGQFDRSIHKSVCGGIIVCYATAVIEIGQADQKAAKQPALDVGQRQKPTYSRSVNGLKAVARVPQALAEHVQPGRVQAQGNVVSLEEKRFQLRQVRCEITVAVRANRQGSGRRPERSR